MCFENDKYSKDIVNVKHTIGHLYVGINVCFTPFSDQYFTTFILTSVCFAIENSVINQYSFAGAEYYSKTAIVIVNACAIMLLMTYFIRHVLIQFFVLQTDAEKTSETLTQILNNLPDGVLMFENG